MSLAFEIWATVFTLLSVWRYGDNSLWGPGFAFIGHIGWWGLTFTADLWGLAPLHAAMLFIQVRNYLVMRKNN